MQELPHQCRNLRAVGLALTEMWVPLASIFLPFLLNPAE